MSSIQTPTELVAAFPYMFPKDMIDSISLNRGWFHTFSELCVAINEALGDERDQREFYWIQTKSKFGAARFYFSMKSTAPAGVHYSIQQTDGSLKMVGKPKSKDPLMQQIDDLVCAAHELTSHQCEVCGAPAKIGRHGGVYATYCPEHARMTAVNEGLPPHYWSASDAAGDWR